jgi:cleavage and polyadenylation specificity factor subunit 1
MQCYTELTPPTAVTHSLTLPFISADSDNLIVAKTSLLQIFKTKSVPRPGRERSKESAHDTKLVLVCEYTLSGTITSLVGVKVQASNTAALLVGFKDAKLSLVEWDPERPGLSTISIHYYEQDELQGSPWAPNLGSCVNYLTVDPSSRCAALKFGTRNLAILPFKQGDEDVNMDDNWDEDLDGPRPEKIVSKVNNVDNNEGTPYGSSFVMRLSNLDPNLTHPIHLAFLYEYREPTFGVLSSTLSPSSALLYERKDHLTYMVFTLDLHQKASTTILSVPGLPYDLFKVIPLPAPIGGTLLLGGNELVHVDQAGKAIGVGVNMFWKQCTATKAVTLVDQSDLDLRLEGSTVVLLSIENGEMLIILQTGALAILSFLVDGRSVTGLSVRKVSSESGGRLITTGPSSASALGSNTLFLGSENGNSTVLGWSRRSSQVSRRKSRVQLNDGLGETLTDEDEEEEDDDLDDDLYGESSAVNPVSMNGVDKPDSSNSKIGDYVFRIHDSLINIAPMKNLTFGKAIICSTSNEELNAAGVTSNLKLVAATGRDEAGALALINQNIQPKVIGRFEFPDARGIWAMSAEKPTSEESEKDALATSESQESQYDRLMIVSKAAVDGVEESDVYTLTPTGFEALLGTEFEHSAGCTIEAGTLGRGMRVIQVLKSEVRSYDGGEFPYFLQTFSRFAMVECEVPYEYDHGRGFSFLYHLLLLSGALFGNVSCPIASMKVFYHDCVYMPL